MISVNEKHHSTIKPKKENGTWILSRICTVRPVSRWLGLGGVNFWVILASEQWFGFDRHAAYPFSSQPWTQ